MLNPEWIQHLGRVGYSLSLLVSILITLAIFSFLYKDNPLFRIAESIFAGLSIGYLLGVHFYGTILPNALIPLFQPPLLLSDFVGLIPFIMGLFFFIPFIYPRAGWLIGVPLAFYFGYGAGVSVIPAIDTYLVRQFSTAILQAVAFRNDIATGQFLPILGGLLTLIVGLGGVLAVLAYFYFSYPHRGVYGTFTRFGIWIVMIGFGAAFGYTVMARVSLVINRFNFLMKAVKYIFTGSV